MRERERVRDEGERERSYSILSLYDKKFLNWHRTSCVVSITTVAT